MFTSIKILSLTLFLKNERAQTAIQNIDNSICSTQNAKGNFNHSGAGDSGSPLLKVNDGVVQFYAIISRGGTIQNTDPERPAGVPKFGSSPIAFTRLKDYYEWMLKCMNTYKNRRNPCPKGVSWKSRNSQ